MDEFASRMRQILLERIPWLSRRIHQSDEQTDLHNGHDHIDDSRRIPQGDREWNWDSAEERLSAAFESGGVSAWAESAMQELEEEARIERRKRGL